MATMVDLNLLEFAAKRTNFGGVSLYGSVNGSVNVSVNGSCSGLRLR